MSTLSTSFPYAPPTFATNTSGFTSDRVQAHEVQPQRPRVAGHEIHALARAARGALHQIVERRDRHDALPVAVEREANVAEVRPGEELRLGEAVEALGLLHDADERLVPVRLPVQPPEVLLCDRLAQERMARREDATDRLDRMAREGDREARLPLNLRGVAG